MAVFYHDEKDAFRQSGPSTPTVLLLTIGSHAEPARIPAGSVADLSYDPAGDILYLLRKEAPQLCVVSGRRGAVLRHSHIATAEPPTMSRFQPSTRSLLVCAGPEVAEVDPNSGEVLRVVLRADQPLRFLEVDGKTSVACAANDQHLFLWGTDAASVLVLEHGAGSVLGVTMGGGSIVCLYQAVGRDRRDMRRAILVSTGLRLDSSGKVVHGTGNEPLS